MGQSQNLSGLCEVFRLLSLDRLMLSFVRFSYNAEFLKNILQKIIFQKNNNILR